MLAPWYIWTGHHLGKTAFYSGLAIYIRIKCAALHVEYLLSVITNMPYDGCIVIVCCYSVCLDLGAMFTSSHS